MDLIQMWIQIIPKIENLITVKLVLCWTQLQWILG